MRAGLLKEPIRILESHLTTNDFGEQTEQWITKYNTKARLVNDGGDRSIINGEIFYSNIKTFEVRSYVPVDEFDRIQWNNQVWRILNIQPDKIKMNKTIRAELVND